MFFEDFEIGQKFQCEPALITAEEIAEFADKYDPLPVHTDDEYAKQTMFNGIISSGFLTISTAWGQWIRLKKFDKDFIVGKGLEYIKFTAPVRANDVLYTEVEVVNLHKSSKPHRGEITIDITVKNQHEEIVLLTQVKALIKTKIAQLETTSV